MKITVYSSQPYDEEYFNKINKSYGYKLVYLEAALDKLTVKLAEGSDAICVFVNDQVDAASISVLSKLGVKTIALRSAGFNNVDLEAALDAGIKVVRVPAYSPQGVAEHAVAMLLTLNRKTHKAYNRVRESNFSLVGLTGFNLYKKKVGIIGLGKIGLAFADIMNGFGCEVLGFDPAVASVPDFIRQVNEQELFSESDIISLHCPLLPATKHIISSTSIARMKRGVYLINTSRGALVNTKDVIKGLKSGKIGALGIDVYEQEEKLFFRDLSGHIIDDDDILRLMSFPNVLITAHQGFFTQEALTEIAATTFKNLQDLEQQGSSINEVKPLA